jgi:hypothetical protein
MDRIDSKLRAFRGSTAARSFIITYGIAAFSFFMLRSSASGVPAPGAGMFVAGLAIQLAVWIATAQIKRRIGEAEVAMRIHHVIALIADGLTVLLFAIGTFRAIGTATELL